MMDGEREACKENQGCANRKDEREKWTWQLWRHATPITLEGTAFYFAVKRQLAASLHL